MSMRLATSGLLEAELAAVSKYPHVLIRVSAFSALEVSGVMSGLPKLG